MFDCVLPTRNGRHGVAFTRLGRINLKNARHADNPRPLDEQSNCTAARDYSRAYLHHLLKANEILGAVLLTEANLSYYGQLMGDIRAAVTAGQFEELRASMAETWAHNDAAEVNA
jgi:queuine tRNA-ribosyltransferase